MELVDQFNRIDEVVFSALRLIDDLESGRHINKSDRSKLVDALQILIDTRTNK